MLDNVSSLTFSARAGACAVLGNTGSDTEDLSSMNLNASQNVEVMAIELSESGAAEFDSAHRPLFKVDQYTYRW